MGELQNENILLNLDNEDGKNNNTNDHWAERAIVERQTKPTEDLRCYFMAIKNTLLEPPTFN